MLNAMPAAKIPRLVWLLLVAALALTTLVYWPSLSGGYVFDDYPNIVQNTPVHVQSLNWDSLREAAMASPSTVLIRPLAMLSFGIDWYLTGGSPFEMKAVNLVIHLINGLLLFALLRRVTHIAIAGQPGAATSAITHADLLALVVTAAWLLAPINFTAVGYIVQRMEALCQMFVLAGLWGYVAARERMLEGKSGFVQAAASIVLGTCLGALSKESSVLLPLYALVAEWGLFGFRRYGGKIDRRLHALFVVLLVIPGSVACVWMLEHALAPGAWSHRPFTLAGRLLTEPRILLDYVRWSLLPTPNVLALYHDQIPLSLGLLTPPTTLASIACLIAAVCALPFVKRTQPLAAIGTAWFLSAHVLTATIIPLELTFEHRNYFASIGLYLLVFSLLLPAHSRAQMAVARFTACASLLILFATVTWVRAMDWSNPVAFAISEAEKNPDSPRTAYELGRTYVVMSQYKSDSPLVPSAYEALEHAAAMPGADALPDQGLLILSGRLHRPSPPEVWTRLREKLATQPLSAQNVSALHSLGKCDIDGDCNFPTAEMVQTFIAALQHEPPDTRVLSIYASYAINVLHDSQLAIELAQTSLHHQPRDLQARKNLLLLLQTAGRHDDAKTLYLETLRDLPEAAHDRTFREWGERLLQQPTQPPAPMPQ
jgi:tetratricopeptide (TPR) repeat protein